MTDLREEKDYSWKHLNHLQVGRLAEHLVTLELVRAGVDVFSGEVDDRGIDLVARLDANRYIDIQVKSVRLGKTAYVFAPKSSFQLRDNLVMALVVFIEACRPLMYLIPAERWNHAGKERVFKSYDYEKSQSAPEWGLSLTRSRLPDLSPFICPGAADLFREWRLPFQTHRAPAMQLKDIS